jgi:integrase/recombinase XerD
MTHPLEELSKDYLNQKPVSKATKKSYRIAFKHYINYLKDKRIIYAKTSDIIKYKAYRRQIGDSPTWIYIQISALKGLYTYLANHQKRLGLDKGYAYNITVPIQNKQDQYQIKKQILSPHQARDLIVKTKDRRYIWDYRDHAIIYLMLTSGFKRHEIIKAKRRDYKVVRGLPLIYIGPGQTNKNRPFVKLSRGAMRALNDYLVLRDDENPYLFRSHKYAKKSGQLSTTFFTHMFKRVLKKVGLDKNQITPNCLRQSAGIINLLRGGSMSQTYTLLRHVNIESTLVYKSYLDRINDQTEVELESFILSEEELILYHALIPFLDQ